MKFCDVERLIEKNRCKSELCWSGFATVNMTSELLADMILLYNIDWFGYFMYNYSYTYLSVIINSYFYFIIVIEIIIFNNLLSKRSLKNTHDFEPLNSLFIFCFYHSMTKEYKLLSYHEFSFSLLFLSFNHELTTNTSS